MENTPKLVMVCERVDTPFTVQKDGDNYILEAIVAEFGKPNVNDRIYEEKEYLPHLEYLTKKIKKGNLVGEMDHPEKFTVSLQNASHLIEHLEYDEKNRRIMGRIKLLNTDAGRNAKAMIDDGVQLSISSRAAGTVGDDRRVKLKRIFTYDLVADPGFESASLNRINESLGFDPDGDIQIYDMSHMTSEEESAERSLDSNTSTGIVSTPVTTSAIPESLNQWATHIQEKFDALASKVLALENTQSQNEELQEKVESLTKQNEELQAELFVIQEYVTVLSESTEVLIEHSNNTTDEFNILEGYIKTVVPFLDEVVVENRVKSAYLDALSAAQDRGLQAYEHLAENVQLISERVDLVQEDASDLRGFSEMVARETNNVIGIAHTITEAVNSISEGAIPMIEGKDEEKEEVEEGKKPDASEDCEEDDVEEGKSDDEDSDKEEVKEEDESEEDEDKAKPVKESADHGPALVENFNITRLDPRDIHGKIDAIFEEVKKQKVSEITTSMEYPFLTLISESKQREFLGLEPTHKQKVIEAISKAKPLSETEVLAVWESSLNDFLKSRDRWILEMPKKYVPLWESASIQTRNMIARRATTRPLQNATQIKEFWETLPELNQKIGLISLNEEQNLAATTEPTTDGVDLLGYNRNVIDAVTARLGRANGR